MPPWVVGNWVPQSRTPSMVNGHRKGSLSPCDETPVVIGANRSCRLGARKPWPNEPRSRIWRVGCQRKLALGVVEAPTLRVFATLARLPP